MGGGVVAEVMQETTTLEECRRVFSVMPFFSGLSDGDLKGLTTFARAKNLVAGSVIFYEDDDSDAIYFLAEGAVEVFKSDHHGKKLPLVVLRDTGLLGEMGLMTGAPRTATARALISSRVVYFASSTFYEALEGGSAAAFHLVLAFARVLSQRLSDMDDKLFQLFSELNALDETESIAALKRRLLATWSF